jgi:hypothetical protein
MVIPYHSRSLFRCGPYRRPEELQTTELLSFIVSAGDQIGLHNDEFIIRSFVLFDAPFDN